jgi:phosphoribosyl-ATP pyrophosphohydrolase
LEVAAQRVLDKLAENLDLRDMSVESYMHAITEFERRAQKVDEDAAETLCAAMALQEEHSHKRCTLVQAHLADGHRFFLIQRRYILDQRLS